MKPCESIRLRLATREDAVRIVDIFYRSVHEVASRDYTPEQIHAWLPEVPDARLWGEGRMPSRKTWVAEFGGAMAGFAELKPEGWWIVAIPDFFIGFSLEKMI